MLRSALLLLGVAWGAWAVPDSASVTVEKRGEKNWCVMDARISRLIPASLERLAAVIQDYEAYPKLFPKIREANVETVTGAVLLTETVVVEVLGMRNVNRFTLRLTAERTGSVFRLSWTQEAADGSIDSLEGSWTLEDKGGGTLVTYRTHSAVPVKAFGQDVLLRMMLGGETKAVVDAVAKAALQE